MYNLDLTIFISWAGSEWDLVCLRDEKGIVLWNDDFNTPANWVLTNSSTPALDWSFGSGGVMPVGALSPFASTTVGDGYLLIDFNINVKKGIKLIIIPFNTHL